MTCRERRLGILGRPRQLIRQRVARRPPKEAREVALLLRWKPHGVILALEHVPVEPSPCGFEELHVALDVHQRDLAVRSIPCYRVDQGDQVVLVLLGGQRDQAVQSDHEVPAFLCHPVGLHLLLIPEDR